MSGKISAIKKEQTKLDVRRLTTLGMLAAIGVMLVAVIEVPIIPAAPFLKYDPADIPILIGTLIYGPSAGLILTFVVSFIQSFMIHGSGGLIGFVMHVVATGAMVIVAGLIYKYGKKASVKKAEAKLADGEKVPFLSLASQMPWAAVALVAGTLAMTVTMIGINLVLTPIFMGTPVEVVQKMLIPAIIPFNLLKAGLNSLFTFTVYRFVEKIAVN